MPQSPTSKLLAELAARHKRLRDAEWAWFLGKAGQEVCDGTMMWTKEERYLNGPQ